MNATVVLTKIIGPVLLVRAISLLLDPAHFLAIIDGLDREVDTVAFSFFPIAFMMACLALIVLHTDRSTPAAWLIQVMAWGGLAKATGLMLFPGVMAAKAHVLAQAGFLNVILVACIAVGAYFSWFGWVASRTTAVPAVSALEPRR